MSKVKLASMYPDISPTSDKCKQGDTTLFHMYWLCPRLQTFWHEVFHTISIIMKRNLNPNPLIALLGASVDDDPRMTPTERHAVSFSLLLARRAILLRWKGKALPTHTQWLRDIMHCLTLEKIRFSLRGSQDKFYKTWQPFLTHFKAFHTS